MQTGKGGDETRRRGVSHFTDRTSAGSRCSRRAKHTHTRMQCHCLRTLEPDGVVDEVQHVGDGVVLSHFHLLAVCWREQRKAASSLDRETNNGDKRREIIFPATFRSVAWQKFKVLDIHWDVLLIYLLLSTSLTNGPLQCKTDLFLTLDTVKVLRQWQRILSTTNST